MLRRALATCWVLGLACAVACAVACARQRPPCAESRPKSSVLPKHSACLKFYRIDSDELPDPRNTYSIEAVSFDDFRGDPVSAVERYTVGGRPLMRWQDGLAKVDRAHFDALNLQNAGYFEKGERRVIAHVSPEAFRELGGRNLFSFLLRSGTIRVAHLGAEFCIFEETVGADAYRAEIFGYSRHADCGDGGVTKLAFAFEITPNGTMQVSGPTKTSPLDRKWPGH